jgi:branched-chain amino acid transport system substrate-binding protein
MTEMTILPFAAHPRRVARLGFVGLAAALVMSLASCGGPSDQAIQVALRKLSTPTPRAVQAPEPLPADPSGAAPATTGHAPKRTTTPRAQPSSPSIVERAKAPADTVESQPAAANTASTPLVADKSVVKIGQLGLFSGVLGPITNVAPKMMSAWVANANAHGGLNGHPIKLVVADDQGDPATALTLARRLVESEKVLAMAGNINLFGFPQLDQYLRTKNIPFIGDGVDPGWWTGSPVAFPVLTQTSVQGVQGLKTFVDQGATKLAMLYCVEVSSLCTYLFDQTKKSEVGKYVTQSYQISLVAPSYTSQCLRMKQGGIEAVYLLMDTAGAARVAKDCAAQDFRPKIMLLSVDATADMPTIPALADALIPAGTVPPTATGVPGLERYRQVLKTYAPNLGDSGISSYAFAAGEMLGLIGKHLPETPTSQDFLDALWHVKNETLGGLTVPLTYTKGQPAHAAPCVFIWGTADGKWSAPRGAKPIC